MARPPSAIKIAFCSFIFGCMIYLSSDINVQEIPFQQAGKRGELWLSWVVGLKSIFITRDFGFWKECPSWRGWVFLRNLSHIYVSFGKNQVKFRTTKSRRATKNLNSCLLITSILSFSLSTTSLPSTSLSTKSRRAIKNWTSHLPILGTESLGHW